MITSDYCFIDKYGKVLAEESLPADQVAGFAQRLARKHQTTVHIWIAAGEPVKPDKCPDCGEVLPESGPCWHNKFFEEEEPPRLTRAEMMAAEAELRAKVEIELYGRPISSCPIPFRGEAYPARIVTEQDEYF